MYTNKNSDKNFKLWQKATHFFKHYPSVPYIVKWLFISAVIGVLVGSASAVFLQSLDWATNFREKHVWIIAFLPLAGFLVGLLYYYYGKTVEGGNNVILETIQNPSEKIIPFKMAPFVYAGTIITHLFGGSAGREGTALQMAGAITDQLSTPLKLSTYERKIIIIAAVAAGFGAVFGTPLAGAIFALEVFLIGRLRYDAIFPAFASAVLADIVTKLWHTTHTHYAISFVPDASVINILYAVVAGIFFGVTAALFSKLMHLIGGMYKKFISYPPLRAFVGGIIVALIVWLLGTTKYIGLGIPTIVDSFNGLLPPYDFALKILLTVITLAAGFKGGEVTPLFFIGAALGNALSYFIPLPTALLAGMGFVAVFAGATNTPLACTVMALELFEVNCGVYVAIACVVAYLVSGHNSIYGKQIVGEPKHVLFNSHKGKSLNNL
jgi:H+/Cl- antiporter ClcA